MHVSWLLAAVLLVGAGATSERTFSVAEAKRAFYEQTGMRLVTFRSASTPDAVSLRTSPYRTRRFGTFDSLDALVCAHGISGRSLGDGPVDSCTEEGWDAVLQANLRSTFVYC
ncbi:MAG TPA: hypothetical protein VGU26_01930, partial [Gaiellaceae bacterium]|nr:hypothetical protein [Gaiellaceae bacterium]